MSALLLALVSALLMLAASPSVSHADPFSFQPCGDDSGDIGNREWEYLGTQVIGLRATCGKSFYQYFQGPIDTSAGRSLRMLPLGPGVVEKVSFVVRGRDRQADGMDFALAVCSGPIFPQDCGRQVRGATEWPYLPQIDTLTREQPGDIPDNADRLTLFSQCTIAAPDWCDATESVVSFSDFYVEENDPTPPEVTGDFPDGDAWLNYSPSGDMAASDPESGIYESASSANGSEVINYICNGYLGNYSCPPWAVPYDGNGLRLAQGRNTVKVDTRNRAAMHTETEFSFRYDSVAPPHPASLRALGTNGRWLVGDDLRLRWTNDRENVPSLTESGVSGAIVDIEPSIDRGPFTARHEFTGAGISEASITLPWPDTWTINVAVVDAAGNVSDPERLIIDSEDSAMSPPRINSGDMPVFNIDGTADSVTFNWQLGKFGRSGACGHRGWVGKGTPPNLAADPSSKIANAGVTSWTLTQSGLSKLADGENTLALAGVDCAGDVSANMTRDFMVDRVRPTARLEPASRWVPAGSQLRLIADDPGAPSTGSGVKSVWYRIDGNPAVSALGDEIAIPTLEGDHTLTYGAVDRLGNSSLPISPAQRFGVDSQVPSASINQADAGPESFNAVVKDSVSGVVEAWCEISRSGSASGSRIGDTFVSSPGQTAAVTLGLRVPDDALPAGDYDLRVLARDAAGNVQTAVARTLRLPLRARTSLSAAIYSAAKPKAARDAITLDVGAKAGVRGTLRDAGGAPIGGALLRIVAQRDSGGRRLLAELHTAADGSYSHPLGRDVSRSLRVVYSGSATHGGSAAEVRQNVRTEISLKLSARHVRRGGRLFASGKVTLLSASVPARGVPVDIQFCGPRSCTVLKISGRTDSSGGFSIGIPTAYSRATKLILRARVDAPSGWPFAAGSSRRRSVVIR